MDAVAALAQSMCEGFATFAPLTTESTRLLEAGMNTCNDWSRVRLLCPSAQDLASLSRIRQCCFHVGGPADLFLLGDFGRGVVSLQDGIELPSGLYDSTFSGRCILSDGCRVSSTLVVKNVFLGESACVVGCGKVVCEGETTFGNGETFSVGPENGGRDLKLEVGMRFAHICRLAFKLDASKYNGQVAERLNPSSLTVLAARVEAFRCDVIRNSIVGPAAVLSCSTIDTCTLASSPERPVLVTHGAHLFGSILQNGCKASHGCRAEKVFLLESACLGENARVVQSVIGPDSTVAGGECHHSLLGPFVGFHHHSLLIATMWPHGRGNMGYGSMNGSNHTGRVNDQECWMGEGCFLGLGAAIKFPANMLGSPYSLVASATVVTPQKLRMPFSLLIDGGGGGGGEGGTALVVKPGWVLASSPYTIERASFKFMSRRKAKQHTTSYAIVRPTLVDLVRSAKRRLGIYKAGGPDGAIRKVAFISSASIDAGIQAYTAFLQRYALWGLLYVAKNAAFPARLRKVLQSSDRLSLPAADDDDSQLKFLAMDLDELDELDELELGESDAPPLFDPSAIDWFIRSDRPRVLLHQLQVLREELFDSDPNIGPLLDSLFGADGNSSEKLSLPAEHLRAALALLVRLENQYKDAVLESKNRDTPRGEQVIEDFQRVNSFCRTEGKDSVTDRAAKRAAQVEKFVANLL